MSNTTSTVWLECTHCGRWVTLDALVEDETVKRWPKLWRCRDRHGCEQSVRDRQGERR